MGPTRSRGFSRPTTTPTPDELFDVWLPQLSGGELKVLLYIVRRTLGFKKDADSISISQICSGITTRDGRVLDQGTGLSRNTAIQAIKGLTEKRLVLVVEIFICLLNPSLWKVKALSWTSRRRHAGCWWPSVCGKSRPGSWSHR